MPKDIIENKFLTSSLLIIFILVSFGVFFTGNNALAGKCDKDEAGQPKCPSGFRLQVGIPGLTSACDYTAVSYPGGKKTETPKKLYCVKSFPEYIQTFYNLFIGIVGILAVIMIMLGGFQWLLAAGNAQKISGAKTTIISAIMGLVLALSSYTILSFVSPNLTKLSLKVSPISLKGGPTVGICKKDPNNPIMLRGDKVPKCGKTYLLTKPDEKTGKDISCSGFYCEIKETGGRNTVEKEAACLLDSSFGGSCSRSPLIIEDNNKGYGTRSWRFCGPYDLIAGENGKCGGLYVFKYNENIDNKGEAGTDLINKFCYKGNCGVSQNQTCVISYNEGAKIDREWKKLSTGSSGSTGVNVGTLTAECVDNKEWKK